MDDGDLKRLMTLAKDRAVAAQRQKRLVYSKRNQGFCDGMSSAFISMHDLLVEIARRDIHQAINEENKENVIS